MTREPDAQRVHQMAEQLASRKGDRPTTVHLLAALAAVSGTASTLLRDRRLDTDVLLAAARVVLDPQGNGVSRALQRAREFATRSGQSEPTALHVLFALCSDRESAAHRALVQCGADVTKMRLQAMQLATGMAPPRRVVEARTPHAPPPSRAPSRAAPNPQTGTPKATPASVSAATQPVARRRMRAVTKDRFALDPKRFPLLTQVGTNLTAAAATHGLDPVVGRDKEIEQTLDILAKRHGNNVCLVGPAGSGKTSIARGVALRIARGEQVHSLDDRVIIEVEPSLLIAGTGVRGSLAERIAQLRKEVLSLEGRAVVFLDEVHALFSPEVGDEALSELKVAFARGELPCIGATTEDEYKKSIGADAALARRFTRVEVEPLGEEDTLRALEQGIVAFEKHHHTKFSPEALRAAVSWSARYLTDRVLPEKAVAVIDLAGARAKRRSVKEVMPPHMAEVVAELAGVPIERLLETDKDRMLRLESLLGDRVVGHQSALGRIATVLRRNAGGFRSRRPIGTFLLLGPTGVGKTETAKAVAECLFHSEHAMTRLDFSEYAESHAIARLIGAPPGYVGFDAGGQLTEAVRKRPYQVVLLDEFEKAHRDVLEAFLQVFDEGHLTDGRGRRVDFTNTVIFVTSNLGAQAFATAASTRGRIGFGAREEVLERDNAVLAEARKELPPELYNRLDEVLVFRPLERDDVREIARRSLLRVGKELLAARGVHLEVGGGVVDHLLDAGGFDPAFGARPMRRTIARLVEAPIAEMILRGELERGVVAHIEASRGELAIRASADKRAVA